MTALLEQVYTKDVPTVHLELFKADLEYQVERDQCAAHPANLMGQMRCWDERAGVEFSFNMDDPEGRWGWQRAEVDSSCEANRIIRLKARQLGETWIYCGKAVWKAVYQPGSLCLLYRQKFDDAVKLVQRCWYQYQSLPEHLKNGAEVIKPMKGALPTDMLRLRFPDGQISTIQAQSSADASGHGETAAFALLDEFSRIDNAPEIMKAVSSAVGQDGELVIISTANGVSNDQGGGNYFHYLWSHAEEQGLAREFLSWRLHPDRDEHWYETSPEILNLRPWERAEQYPDNPDEAFTLSSATFFDKEAMAHYASLHSPVAYRMEFEETKPGLARKVKKDSGWIRVYHEPQEGRRYAIGADTATGKGLDYNAAYVIDLTEPQIVAEFHGKLDVDQYEMQLHYLGAWYGKAAGAHALIAVEEAGGFGDAVNVGLRDGRNGRPAYRNLYRHRQFKRGDLPEHKSYGFPMNKTTRPQVLSHMEELVREKALDTLPGDLLSEMRVFCRYNPSKPDAGGTWPRAWPDGLHDDRVMAAAIALEMYRQHGYHEKRIVRKATSSKPAYPWLPERDPIPA